MQDAMVTARMSQAKKDAGNRVLERIGTNASQFINDVYDYLIANGASPLESNRAVSESVDPERLSAALAHIDMLAKGSSGHFNNMTDDQIKHEHLVERGLVEA